ncbi:MAG: hypothetical protein JWS10_250 [Cypionkella sp.]|uniref:GGDEF domain-containing protein n=1 Tax=Cypionkella sp. TaxID=2811411 RepID=UPI00260B7A55|nr:diguanylate cyclase [Cypionkella sp.]MDB5657635.1 hypothetical protein [Cypionkella sp.]
MLKDALLFSFNAVGSMAIATLLYGLLQRHIENRILRHTLVGVVMGSAAAVLMAQPIEIINGYQADGRNAFIGIAAVFGGPISAAVAAVITAFMRLWIGGAGVPLGCVMILATATLASFWKVSRNSIKNRRTTTDWLTLAAVLIIPINMMLLVPIPNKAEIVAYLSLLTLVNVMIFGRLMETEQRRGRRERQLNMAANTDVLTSLPNRRKFMDVASAVEAKRQTRKGLLLIDIDHFKKINDAVGHDAGDEVLRIVSQKLADQTRKSDIAARFGGEEFAVLIDAIDQDDLARFAERLRKSLNTNVKYKGSEVVLSVSIGATFCGDQPFSFQNAYNSADKSLYEAKELGRAQSVVTALAA